MNVVGYARVSTEDQGENGGGMGAQIHAIKAECDRKGWNLVDVLGDVASGGSTKKRPSYRRAIEMCETGEADGIVAAKLDRLSRSTLDFAELLERSKTKGFSVVVLDLGVDTNTAHGEMVVSILAALAQWERRMISQRTIEGLAEKRKQGVKIGRPRYGHVPDTIREQILAAHEEGWTNHRIVKVLNAEKIPGPTGGKWHWQGVQTVIDRDLQNA